MYLKSFLYWAVADSGSRFRNFASSDILDLFTRIVLVSSDLFNFMTNLFYWTDRFSTYIVVFIWQHMTTMFSVLTKINHN